MRKIEVLVFDGCPNIEFTLAEVRAGLAAASELADVLVVHVESDAEAERLHFLGSPTVRVDGIDVDASAENREDYGLQCRVYAVDGRLASAPPASWIEATLRGVTEETSTRAAHASSCACAPSRGKADADAG